ncbi:YrhB domain-containing protein [Streptomyces sp. IBSBF 2806]|uniref:YrhB domain-containing protein n=1 Tax=Streptomyces sp. IBSBF 2806 TaxID=2903529 RepID=UPI002FDC0F03
MIEREAAVRAVEEQLEREYQQWRAVSAEAVRMAVVRVKEHELVWIVSWQSEDFVRTRNSKYALFGNGPYLVDRVDGGLHQIGVVSAVTGEWEADYRARIRGLTTLTCPTRRSTSCSVARPTGSDRHPASAASPGARIFSHPSCCADTAPEAACALARGTPRVRIAHLVDKQDANGMKRVEAAPQVAGCVSAQSSRHFGGDGHLVGGCITLQQRTRRLPPR